MTDYIAALNDPRNPYHREAQSLVNKLWHSETTNEGGVLRWTSNGRVPFADVLELAAYVTIPVDVAKSNAARDKETSEFLAEYRARMADHVHSPEELGEMRAAFGPGAKVVNIITGKVTKL